MELIGTLTKKLDISEFQTEQGTKRSQEFVVNDNAPKFSKNVCLKITNEELMASFASVPIGTTMKVFFSPESREYEGRYYTTLKCWKIQTLEQLGGK